MCHFKDFNVVMTLHFLQIPCQTHIGDILCMYTCVEGIFEHIPHMFSPHLTQNVASLRASLVIQFDITWSLLDSIVKHP